MRRHFEVFVFVLLLGGTSESGAQFCDSLQLPVELRYQAGGIQNSSLCVSFVPDRQEWSGNEWAAAVTADAQLVSEPVCIRERGGTYFFDSLYVRRSVDCRAEASQFGEAGTPIHETFYASCVSEADTTAAVPLVGDTTYAGYYLIIYEPDDAGYRLVTTQIGSTFSADSVNTFGFSTELPPPADSTGGLPGSNPVPVGSTLFPSLRATVDNVVPVTKWLPEAALRVYPNPSRGSVHIKVAPHLDLEFAELYDLSGRWIGRWSLFQDHNLRIDALPRGSYLIVVNGPAGHGTRRLLVR